MQARQLSLIRIWDESQIASVRSSLEGRKYVEDDSSLRYQLVTWISTVRANWRAKAVRLKSCRCYSQSHRCFIFFANRKASRRDQRFGIPISIFRKFAIAGFSPSRCLKKDHAVKDNSWLTQLLLTLFGIVHVVSCRFEKTVELRIRYF